MFTKKDLKNGMFGLMEFNGVSYKFVVVNNTFIYQDGDCDYTTKFDDNMVGRYNSAIRVKELRWANSFNTYGLGDVIFDRQKEYKPVLMNVEKHENYGDIGAITPLTGAFGEKLYVGDIVEIYDVENDRMMNQAYVVFNRGEFFVMGLRGLNVDNGNAFYKETNNILFQVRKFKSYENVANKDKHGTITALREG